MGMVNTIFTVNIDSMWCASFVQKPFAFRPKAIARITGYPGCRLSRRFFLIEIDSKSAVFPEGRSLCETGEFCWGGRREPATYLGGSLPVTAP
jgi:hypothetical protein